MYNKIINWINKILTKESWSGLIIGGILAILAFLLFYIIFYGNK